MTAFPPYPAYSGPGPVAPPEPPPILVAVTPPGPQPRLGVAFRLLLTVPHLVVLAVLGVAAEVVAFVGWWGALFTGRLPEFAVTYLSGYLRWSTRVFGYLFLLTDVYPPFSFDDDLAYPVRIAVPERQQLNRAAVLFRFILMVPANIVASVVAYGAGTLMAIAAWLITLVSGRLPASFHLAYVAVLRYQARYYGYVGMLTAAYPGGLYGDHDWPPPAPAGGYAPGGYPAASGYAPDGGYAPGVGYAAPAAYGDPAGYGAPAGWGVPGYAAPPPPEPSPWRFTLTSAARILVTTFIVLGALLDLSGNIARQYFVATNSAPVPAVLLPSISTPQPAPTGDGTEPATRAPR